MRFLHYRQLLRGIIAASLAIAGTQTDIASAGIQSTRWSQICLLNDREYDPLDAGSRYEPMVSVLEGECLLKGSAAENDLDDCIAANRFHIDRQVAFSLLHHHLPRIHCSSWIHGFRTTGQELGGFLAQQFQYGRSSRGHLVALALALGQLPDAPIIETVAEGMVDPPLPAREADGNLFVYVFREGADSVSNFDSCFAETVGGRPPVLEGDQQAYVSNAVAATNALSATEDDGVGHCSVPSSEAMAPSEAYGDLVIASEPTASFEQTLFDQWVSPDWNIQHWEIHTHAPRYEYTLEGFAAKPMFPPGGLLVDLTQSSSLLPEETISPSEQEEDVLPIATVAEVTVTEEVSAVEDAAAAESNELEAWLSTAWASMLSGIQQRWSDLEPAAQEMSVQSTRIVSRKLKQLGMMLIQSADRLDQVSIPIGIAGRSGTQR